MEWWCLLQLENNFPSDNVPIAEARDDLQNGLQRQLIMKRMLQLQQTLKNKAKINVIAPELIK